MACVAPRAVVPSVACAGQQCDGVGGAKNGPNKGRSMGPLAGKIHSMGGGIILVSFWYHAIR